MSRTPSPLTADQRRAFSDLVRQARGGRRWPEAVAAVEAHLGEETIDYQWLQWLESGPAEPLRNIPRLNAVILGYGPPLSWQAMLRALGARADHRKGQA